MKCNEMYDRYRIPSRNTAERAQPKSATSGGADPVRRRQPVARATATSDLGIPVRGQCCPPGRRPGGPRPALQNTPPVPTGSNTRFQQVPTIPTIPAISNSFRRLLKVKPQKCATRLLSGENPYLPYFNIRYHMLRIYIIYAL